MNNSLNLMSAAARRKSLLRATVTIWLKVYMMAALILATDWGLAWWDGRNATLTRESLESQYAPINRVKTESRTYLAEIEKLEEQERVPLAISVQRSALALLGSVSQAASQTKVYVQQFDFRDAGDVASSMASQRTLQLRGIGQDDEAVSGFVEMLKGMKMFSRVQLVSSVSKQVNDQMVREFQVECSFN